MPPLPHPIRAGLGLAVTAVEETRKLPSTLLSLPMDVLGRVAQASVRVQQHYATLTHKGDELIKHLQGGAPQEPPAWARFDEPVSAAEISRAIDLAEGTPNGASNG